MVVNSGCIINRDFNMLFNKLWRILLLIFLAIIVAGCTGSDDPSTQQDSPTFRIFPNVYPNEDQTEVPTATAVTAFIGMSVSGTTPDLDESTLEAAFSLLGPAPVSGSYTFEPNDRFFRFVPDAPLQPYTKYMGTFTTDLANSEGVHPDESFSWSFTTGRSIVSVSISSEEVFGNYGSSYPDISDDGKIVSFFSQSDNLVPGDTNLHDDIFVRNIETGETTRVSFNPGGGQRGFDSRKSVISGDGRYVAFLSNNFFVHDTNLGITSQIDVTDPLATGKTVYSIIEDFPAISFDGKYVAFQSARGNLTPEDTTGSRDIFLRDTVLNTTSLISVSSDEVQANHHSYEPSISSDGRYVAFSSYATNLVSGDSNGVGDIFVRDVLNGTTSRASVAAGGAIEANGHSYSPIVSSNGQYVVFDSEANNLVPNDFNGVKDVFLHDFNTGITRRVSVDTSGVEGDRMSSLSDMSTDGRYILFASQAMNWPDSNKISFIDYNLYLHDTVTGETKRVFRCCPGASAISADGKYIAVTAADSELDASDNNYTYDVYRARLYPEVP